MASDPTRISLAAAAEAAATPEEAATPREPAPPRPSRPLDWLFQFVPALESLRSYSWRSFRLDFFAGLTVAAVAVPQAMAYASVADLPPYIGLYTAIVMTFVGALFDSSRQLINGPTNAISIALLSALVLFPVQERVAAAIAMAFLIGLIQTGITLLRLGDLTRYISQSVIVGFTLGAALLLVLDQLKNLLGLPAVGTGHDHFLARFWLTLAQLGKLHAPTLLLGLGTMVIVLALRLLSTRLRVPLPSFLIAIVTMAAVVVVFDLEDGGVSVIGAIPSSLPALEAPHFSWSGRARLASSGSGHRHPRFARGDRHGQGDREPDPAEARHQPAVLERRRGEPDRQLLSVHARLRVADALGDQRASGGGDAMVRRFQRPGGRGHRRAVRPLRALHPAGEPGRHPAHLGLAPGRLEAAGASPAHDAFRRQHRGRDGAGGGAGERRVLHLDRGLPVLRFLRAARGAHPFERADPHGRTCAA
ncbi:MAG: SulP family inorganic anion transporter [Gemmataceae bacterium]